MTGLVSFLSPVWLAGLPAVLAGLLYVYRKHASQRRRVVSSLLLLKDFVRPSIEKASIRLPIRFFLELAVLSLLVLALAGIRAGSPPPHVAFIVDDSLSTRAATADGSANSSIRNAARRALSELPLGATIDLYRTPARRPVLSDVGAGAASDELERDVSPFHRDDLESLITAAGRKNYDRILVFSDKEVSAGSLSNELSFQSLRTEVVRRDNAAIERLSRDERRKMLHIGVRSFGAQRFTGVVEVNGVRSERISADPNGSVTLDVADQDDVKTVRVKLLPDVFDAIRDDNVAAVEARGSSEAPIVIVTELPESSLGIESIGDYRFKVETPEQYRGDRGERRAVIFHRYAPDELPRVPSLFILPGDSKLFPTRGAHSDLSATRWDSSNPITTYLHLELFTASKAQTFSPLPWQTVVVSSEEGPLLLAGEKDGARSVVTGFDLLPFHGRESPVLSILTLNVLKWLASGAADVTTGSTFYAESESDLASNSIDLSFFEPPKKKSSSDASDLLRTILLIAVSILLTADMVLFMKSGRVIGARTT